MLTSAALSPANVLVGLGSCRFISQMLNCRKSGKTAAQSNTLIFQVVLNNKDDIISGVILLLRHIVAMIQGEWNGMRLKDLITNLNGRQISIYDF